MTDDCGGRPAPPQLVRVGASVLITQGAVFPECTPPGPPTFRYDPYAYSYSINLGVLGDDTYSVEWRFFPIDGSPFLFQYQGNPYRTTFVVRGGSLVPFCGSREFPALVVWHGTFASRSGSFRIETQAPQAAR